MSTKDDSNNNTEIFDEMAKSSINNYIISQRSQIRLLNKSENTTYMISDLEQEVRTILRINRPGYHTPQELIGELMWMEEIRNKTQLLIPQPIAGLNGEFVQILTHNALPNPYNSVMFTFLNGRQPDESNEGQLVEQFHILGEITAVLHKNAMEWPRSQTLPRFTWDYESILGDKPRWGKWEAAAGMTAELESLCSRASKVIKRRLGEYGKGKERFGLIHADLRLANLLVDNDKIAVIDFDDCGFGWYMFDFGAAVSFIEHKPYIPDLLASWLDGYRRVRNVSQEEENEIPTFVIMRRLMLLGWLASHYDSDRPIELEDDYTIKTAEIAENYLLKFS